MTHEFPRRLFVGHSTAENNLGANISTRIHAYPSLLPRYQCRTSTQTSSDKIRRTQPSVVSDSFCLAASITEHRAGAYKTRHTHIAPKEKPNMMLTSISQSPQHRVPAYKTSKTPEFWS